MSKPIIFPYGINLQDGGKVNLFPGAKVEFKNRDGEWLALFLIIDSGATISALPKSDAEIMGINAATGAPALVAGIGNQYMKGWQHYVAAKLNGTRLRIPITFLDNNNAPRVLGRAGIFNNFTIIFEESMKRSGFFDEHTTGFRAIRKILGAEK